MKQELEYIVILRDGIRYEMEWENVGRILHCPRSQNKNTMIELWIDHRRTFINVDMVVAIEKKEPKNFDKRTKWQRLVDRFKRK
jgi:hypothetical protein